MSADYKYSASPIAKRGTSGAHTTHSNKSIQRCERQEAQFSHLRAVSYAQEHGRGVCLEARDGLGLPCLPDRLDRLPDPYAHRQRLEVRVHLRPPHAQEEEQHRFDSI